MVEIKSFTGRGERFGSGGGASEPWPDALEAFTGTREMSAKPMLEYFAPLMEWLEEQNEGEKAGW